MVTLVKLVFGAMTKVIPSPVLPYLYRLFADSSLSEGSIVKAKVAEKEKIELSVRLRVWNGEG